MRCCETYQEEKKSSHLVLKIGQINVIQFKISPLPILADTSLLIKVSPLLRGLIHNDGFVAAKYTERIAFDGVLRGLNVDDMRTSLSWSIRALILPFIHFGDCRHFKRVPIWFVQCDGDGVNTLNAKGFI